MIKQPPLEMTPESIRLIPIKSKPSEQLKTIQTRPNSLFVVYLLVSVFPEPAGPLQEENLYIACDCEIVE